MSNRSSQVLGTGFMLAMLLATFASFAQDAADEDDLMPAVDTSAQAAVVEDELMPAVDTSVASSENEDEEEEPRVARDITRTTTDNRVMDSMELGRTEITGSQELPKVLYIVPWQKSDPGNLMGRPVNTLLDEVLAPIDREEFVRRIEYFDDLYGEDEQERAQP